MPAATSAATAAYLTHLEHGQGGSRGFTETEASGAASGHDAVCAFLNHIEKARGLSVHTVTRYQCSLAKLVAYLDTKFGAGAWSWERLEASTVRAFLGDLRRAPEKDVAHTPHNRGKPLSNRSIGNVLSAIRSFYRYLQSIDAVPGNPARHIRSPKIAKRLPRYLSIGEMAAVFGDAEARAASGQFLALRDLAILELLYSTGMRVAEIQGLNGDDLNMLDQEVLIRGKGKKERLNPFGNAATRALLRYERERTQHIETRQRPADRRAVFLGLNGQRMSIAGIQYVVMSAVQRVLGADCGLTVHGIRHTFATHMLDAGGDLRAVQELLGHASVTSTQIYTHCTTSHLRAVYLSAFPRARASATTEDLAAVARLPLTNARERLTTPEDCPQAPPPFVWPPIGELPNENDRRPNGRLSNKGARAIRKRRSIVRQRQELDARIAHERVLDALTH
jgi:site-specific recombinase XerD